MEILLVGNGLNIALSNSPDKYNILEKAIEEFLKKINYDGYTNREDFNFENFLEWLGPSSRNKEYQKIYNTYSKTEKLLSYDLELLAQLHFSSLKFENLNGAERKSILLWRNLLRENIVKELESFEDAFSAEIVKKINEKYDFIVTTNYDLNLESSGVKNVFHAHGSLKDKNSIELVTFKNYIKIFEEIKKRIPSEEKINIDIFGISLFNEIHILNVLFNLKTEYKNNLEINQFIYANSPTEFDFHDASNIYLNYFYELNWGDTVTVKNRNNNNEIYYYNRIDVKKWKLTKNQQTTQSTLTDTFLSDEIIISFLKKTLPQPSKNDIVLFKFIFNFCKNIKTHSHSQHFLNEMDQSFVPSTIDIDWNKILE